MSPIAEVLLRAEWAYRGGDVLDQLIMDLHIYPTGSARVVLLDLVVFRA